MGSDEGADGQVLERAAQRLGGSGREADGDRFGLPRQPGGQRQEGHPLPQPEERARQGRHGAAHQRDREILRVARQGRRPEQGDERRLDGYVQVARERKEDRTARRLWAGERRDGLPRRGDLGDREERPLPDAEEHLGEPERQALRLRMRCAHLAAALAAWCVLVSATLAQDRIEVVTTTTDLRSLTKAVGGERVAVVSLVPAGMDAEEYQPKPQDALRLKTARAFVRVGLDYDLWADRLLLAMPNETIRRGGAGYVDASYSIATLEVRGMSVGPGDGHAHGNGNPHYWLDPHNAEVMTATIAGRALRLDPESAGTYEATRAAFLARLNDKRTEWESKLAPLRGMPLVAYHNSWPYFARRFRLDFVGFIEVKPGVPPSPRPPPPTPR